MRWAMKNRMNLTDAEVIELSDAINHLGNNIGASSIDILAVVSTRGWVTKGAGLAANEVGGLAAALMQSSRSPEIAATGYRTSCSPSAPARPQRSRRSR